MSTRANLKLIDELAVDRCVSRTALLARGMTDREVDSLRQRGFLGDVFRGTYAVGAPRLTQREFLRASELHAGPGAFASGWTGLELRGVLPERRANASFTTTRRNVSTPIRTKVKLVAGTHGWLDVTQSTPSLLVPLETISGFRTTLLPRTLVDVAATHGMGVLMRAWSEAEFLTLLDADALAAEVSNGSRRAGTPLVRRRLHEAFPLTRPGMDIRSRKERLFLALVRKAGLPEPQVNVWLRVGGEMYLVDFYWPELRLVVEVDGPQHELPERSEKDKVRDTELANHDFGLRRFTTTRLVNEEAWCIDSLLAAHRVQARLIALAA